MWKIFLTDLEIVTPDSTNTVRKERLSIWVNVVTDVAELLRMVFPGTHISLFQT